MANKIRYGLSNVHYFTITETASGITYGEAKALPGATALSLSPEGETSATYADNIAYVSLTTNNGYSGTLSLLTITDDFKKDVMKYETGTDGVLHENGNANPSAFGMVFEVQGDEEASRYVAYKVVPGRMSLNANTKQETIEPDGTDLDITIMPVIKGETAYIMSEVKKSAAPYSNVISTLTLPVGSGS